jgi:hypothetical protein
MPSLKNTIASLAETFSAGVIAAIRSASLQEILDGGSASSASVRRGPGRPAKVNGSPATTTVMPERARKGKGGRLARRSPSDIEHVIGLVVAKLGEHKGGLRSEQLQKLLKLDKKEITRPLETALAAKKITKKGQKRSTTYFGK